MTYHDNLCRKLDDLFFWQSRFYLRERSLARQLKALGVPWEILTVKVELDFTDLPRKRGGEGKLHRALKKFAYNMLVEQGEKQPEYEVDYIDVYAPTLKIGIECGDIYAERLIGRFIEPHEFKELWVLMYPKKNGESILVKFKQS